VTPNIDKSGNDTTVTSKTAPKASPTTTTATTTNNKNNKTINPQAAKVQINTGIAVFWRDDKKYYACTVKKKDGHRCFLEYEDGESEWLDLRFEKFRFLDDEDFGEDDAMVSSDAEEEETTPQKNKNKTINSSTRKRPRIHDSDDEEFEFDSDSSEDKHDEEFDDAVEEEEEQADDWLVSDDDNDIDDHEDEQPRKKKKVATKTSIKVTQHKPTNDVLTPRTTPKTSRPVSSSDSAVTPTSLNSFSAFSQAQATQENSNITTGAPRKVTPPSSTRTSATSIAMEASNGGINADGTPRALPYVMNAVNPTGSHLHNHLKFLLDPKDSRGRPKGSPNYDPRTLTVDYRELIARNNNKKLSPGVEQWWKTKEQYFDTVLLFKTGKFYEMFHMDADIGVHVLGFQYMKGHIAHAGFPEVSYGNFSDKLVRAGYKVTRVEQTETPEMLKERKKMTRGEKPKVICREVCSILTMGTRTFCYLDNADLTNSNENESMQVGPLMAIREVLCTDIDNHGDAMEVDTDPDAVRPVCEYGIVVVDAARAKITIGQFADDVLRTRMTTLIATFSPSEILLEGEEDGASPTLRGLLKSLQATSASPFLVENIHPTETFPKSTAVDADIRLKLDRGIVKPWNTQETLRELHRRGYFPKGSKQQQDVESISRWPRVLRSVVEGGAELALSSFGAALFYLQRNLIDAEILSMGNIKAYIPPVSPVASEGKISRDRLDDGADELEPTPAALAGTAAATPPTISAFETDNEEDRIKHMSLDGNTLVQLEILANSIDYKQTGSLWSKINFTKTPHGERMLRAWLLRPLFRKADIDRRADAVEELISGDVAMALDEATSLLTGVGDLERLLAKIHALSGQKMPGADDEDALLSHPSSRAVLYETKTYTKRKVGDFSKILNGLRSASKIPELFVGLDIQSGLLKNIVTSSQAGGFFPDIHQDVEWFFSVFDFEKAAKGEFEPGRGVDTDFDEACDAIDQIHQQLDDFKHDMCSNVLSSNAKNTWVYKNTTPDAKDKFVIELPVFVKNIPDSFRMVGKRGTGAKQINKYKAAAVEDLVLSLEQAIEVHKERKARQMQHIFAKFAEKRTFWAAVASCTAVLDALGSLARLAGQPGYCRPKILECPLDAAPCIKIVQGRHPCVEKTPGCEEFIPNDLNLGSLEPGKANVLLLSGPNMGGKSTLLRQTCLISILAQVRALICAG